MLPLIDLNAQYASLKPRIDEAISEVIASSRFIGGPQVERFCQAFGDFTGQTQVIPCANGTDALELVLDAWEIGAGDEVIVPAMSWISTSEIVATRGAKPVFVDIEPGSYCLDPQLVGAAIGPRTRAIIAVHLYGHPANLTALRRLADEHELYLIEDSAQAHGAKWNDRHVGNFGDAATYSFFPSKGLGAYGDAGAATCHNEELANRIRALANHGMPGKRHHHVYHGRNSRMDALQAAVLNVKLPYLEGWIKAKQHIARHYRQRLANVEGLTLPSVAEGAYHGYHLYVIRTERRNELAAYLREAGIATAVHYPVPLPLHACYESMGLRAEDYPVATKLSRTTLSLPMFAELTSEQIDYVCDHLYSFFYA